jgi:hypothetical protein
VASASSTAVATGEEVPPRIVGRRPAEFQGSRIVSDTRAEHIPGSPMGYSYITLADGRRVYGCVECGPVICLRRDTVYKHRRLYHGKNGQGREQPPLLEPDAEDEAPKPVVRPRSAEKFVVAPHVAAMTLEDLINMGIRLGAIGDQLGRVEAERDAWKQRCLEAEARIRQYERKSAKAKQLLASLEEG